MTMLPDIALMKTGLRCLCPQCGKSSIYKPGFSLDLKKRCESCGLDLSRNDSADGPAVFLIFVLGFLIVPLALAVDAWLSPPLWLHTILWGVVLLALTLGVLKPLKAYIIALQFKHRPEDWA